MRKMSISSAENERAIVLRVGSQHGGSMQYVEAEAVAIGDARLRATAVGDPVAVELSVGHVVRHFVGVFGPLQRLRGG